MAMDLGSGSVFFSGFGFGLEKFMDPDPFNIRPDTPPSLFRCYASKKGVFLIKKN